MVMVMVQAFISINQIFKNFVEKVFKVLTQTFPLITDYTPGSAN